VVTGSNKHDTPSEPQKRLEALPSEISELYETLWRRLDPTEQVLYRQDAARFLNWMLTWTSPIQPSAYSKLPCVALLMLA
jgi:hypothetical protein